jgi:predicted RNA-binding Zn ribbon-like protein
MSGTIDEAGASVIVPRPALCLDFANTIAWRGSEPQESLHSFAELLEWCVSNGAAGDIDRLRGWASKHRAQAIAVFQDALALRETIYRICFATAESRAPAARDIEEVNVALQRAPTRRVLTHSGGAFGWRLEASGHSAAVLLTPVLWSLGDLLVSSNATRLRYCSNEKCRWLFLDDSRNGSRRWCSMQACGNRAKAHRHYLRQKKL